MDLNKLIARARAILLTPKTEWPVIAGEPTTVADLYKGYIVWLAAIPALFAFLKLSIVGVSLPFGGAVRVGMGSALSSMVLGYVLSLAVIYVMALIVDALAPTFGGQKDRLQALKTVAYAYTAAWIAGIGQILPLLAMLIALAGAIYSIYLLYLGLPHTMKCPQDKAGGYTAVTIIIGIVLGIVVAAVVGSLSGVGSIAGRSSVFNSRDDVRFEEGSPLARLEQMGQNVEEAGRKLEAAQRSGDQQAQSEAMTEMMGAVLGADAQVEALAPERLKAFVPDELAGLPRTDLSTERSGAMGLQISEARATYANDSGRTLNLQITDTGGAKGFLALADWADLESQSESVSGYEKTYRKGGQLVHERWDRDGSWGEYTVVVGERFAVKVDGQAGSMDELRGALDAVDLGRLEALRNEGVEEN